MTKQKLIILTTVLVDVLGFGIVIPILPYYLSEFGAHAFTVTLIFAVFSFCSFISNPFLGALSDKIGRRPVLLLSIFSTSIGWFVFASAASIPILFLGRIIDGLAAGNFTTAQSYLVDISTDDKDRTANLGIIGATFGIGFMLGPLLGGVLSTVSHAFPFYFAGCMALVNGVVAFFMLPETNNNRNSARLRFNPVAPLVKAYRMHQLRRLYIVWLLFALAIVISQTLFGLFAQKVFAFSAFQTGMFFTLAGVIIAINQIALLKQFWLKKFTEMSLQKSMLAVLAIGLLGIATQSVTIFFCSLLFLGTGQALLRVIITSRAVGQAEVTSRGEVMGITSSLMSFAMVTGPLIGGTLFEMNYSLPYIFSAVLLFTGFLLSDSTAIASNTATE
jgi:DHA1 family tetracycline resistance protein-like MFS transporter